MFLVLYAMSAVASAVLGIYTLVLDRKSRINQSFSLLCFALCLWAVLLMRMTQASDLATASKYWKLTVIAWTFLYPSLSVFALLVSGKEGWLKKGWVWALLIVPALINFLIYHISPIEAQEIVKVSLGWSYVNNPDRGLIYRHYFNVFYVTHIAFTAIILHRWQGEAVEISKKKQAKLILHTLVAVSIVGTLIDVLLPLFLIAVLPPTTVFLSIFIMMGVGYSIRKYGLMTMTNEVILSNVMQAMIEGLVLVDNHFNIIQVNRGILVLLGYQEEDLLHLHLKQFLSDEGWKQAQRVSSGLEVMLRRKSGDLIPALASSSHVYNRFQEKMGTVFVIQDLRELHLAKQKLEEAYGSLEEEVKIRTGELMEANHQLGHEVEIRIENEMRIKELAYHDHLTHLPNRRYFMEEVEAQLQEAQRLMQPFAILFLDLDNFKTYNDSLGHGSGDQLLCEVANRLKEILGKDDCLSRFGGDEFMLLIREARKGEELDQLCERILQVFSKPYHTKENLIYITASIGVSLYPEGGITAEDLIKHADLAMYRTKAMGKGRFNYFDPSMTLNLEQNLKLSNEMHTALAKHQWELYYQPQVDIRTEKIVGVEALLRWNHPDYGQIQPNIFIPIAENNGLIIPVGQWVMKQAMRDFASFQAYGVKGMAVNLSVKQLDDPRIISQVQSVIQASPCSNACLELEITESMLSYNQEQMIQVIRSLKDLGIRIAIDDFGTDYSSLSYLKNFSVDRIKIPKDFIDGIGECLEDESIIAAVALMASKLQMGLVAEGVETPGQTAYLRSISNLVVQGYVYYKPMPKADLLAVLQDQDQRKIREV